MSANLDNKVTQETGKLSYEGYKKVWEDDFDGTEISRDDWNIELHEAGWVNEELQEYVDNDQVIYVEDSNLVLQSKVDADGKITSGRVSTMGKHDWTYGIVEARVKFPVGKGFLPAFWMMPQDEDNYGQWPKCGEIDIAEVMGQETDMLYGTIHYGVPHEQNQGSYRCPDDQADFAADYHTYAIEWTPEALIWYCDGVKFHEARSWYSAVEGEEKRAFPAPFDQPFGVILNLAVGGSWVGYPDEDTVVDGAKYYIDYVRVYQKED